MEYIQFSLTVNEGKWLIAHGISQMPEVQRAMEHGKVVFKAGTTVSCVSQLLTGIRADLHPGHRVQPDQRLRRASDALHRGAVPLPG